MPAIEIVKGTAADVPRLEPLWVAVHQESMPELAPYVSDAKTWEELRRHYEELFTKPDTELLLALRGGELVGYASRTCLRSARRSSRTRGEPARASASSSRCRWLRRVAAWASAGRCWTPSMRRSRRAASATIVGALPGNGGALRLYERRGFPPDLAVPVALRRALSQ